MGVAAHGDRFPHGVDPGLEEGKLGFELGSSDSGPVFWEETHFPPKPTLCTGSGLLAEELRLSRGVAVVTQQPGTEAHSPMCLQRPGTSMEQAHEIGRAHRA